MQCKYEFTFTRYTTLMWMHLEVSSAQACSSTFDGDFLYEQVSEGKGLYF